MHRFRQLGKSKSATQCAGQRTEDSRVDNYYKKALAQANKDCTSDVRTFANPIQLPIKKGVTQREKQIPLHDFFQLFNACLKPMLQNLKRKRGVDIDGGRLTFADDVLLPAKNTSEAIEN